MGGGWNAGGNQRDADRAKAQKKAAAAAKGKIKESAASLQKRREQYVFHCLFRSSSVPIDLSSPRR